MRPDLKLHLYAGAFLGLVGGLVSPWAGIALAALIGGGKELVWDRWMKRGTPAADDFLYTLGAGIVAAALVDLVRNLL